MGPLLYQCIYLCNVIIFIINIKFYQNQKDIHPLPCSVWSHRTYPGSLEGVIKGGGGDIDWGGILEEERNA